MVGVYAAKSPLAPLTPYLFAFSEDVTGPTGGVKSKNTVQKIYQQDIFKCQEFAQAGPLGSCSVRKISACRKKGASKDEKNLQGRWKSTTQVSDIYDDIELPYPDTKVAALLCVGGPVKYKVLEDSRVTNECNPKWLD